MINIDKIKSKIKYFKNKNIKVCACVKANAYGVGLVNVVKQIYKNVDYFAVAKVCELIKIRRIGVFTKVVILSPVLNEDIENAIKYGGELTIDSLERLKEVESCAIKLNKIAKVHIKIDTGMRRFGVTSINEYVKMLDLIKDGTHVSLSGVYSHFYSQHSALQLKQREIFERIIIETHRRQFYPIFHLSASHGLYDSNNLFDMVRLGICLYEQNVSLTSNIIAIKILRQGEGIGYDHKFKARKDMRVGVVGIGYGDGIMRKYSNNGVVEILGQQYNIIGNICMDCLFVDLQDNISIKIGDKVTLFGNNVINICEVASKCDTITYEILTGITCRVKREQVHASNYRSI